MADIGELIQNSYYLKTKKFPSTIETLAKEKLLEIIEKYGSPNKDAELEKLLSKYLPTTYQKVKRKILSFFNMGVYHSEEEKLESDLKEEYTTKQHNNLQQIFELGSNVLSFKEIGELFFRGKISPSRYMFLYSKLRKQT